MYKAIKDNKIIAISDTDAEFFCVVKDSVVEDTEHVSADYDQYNGEYLLKKDIPLPTHDEQSKKRSQEYQVYVDPITCHINRLKDEEQTEEVVQKIKELTAERNTKVAEIKEKYPYYEPSNN